MPPRLSLFLLTTPVVLAATVLGGTLLFRELPHSMFLYDEADYAYAASQGIRANYLDAPTTTLADFLPLGLANRNARTNTETQGKPGESLSETIRASNDIAFYRHFHPPLYFYGLSIARSLFGNDERTLRCVSLIAVAAAAALTAAFAFLLLLQVGVRIGPAIAAGATALSFSASSSVLIETGMTVTPHSLFAAVAAATLGCGGMFLTDGKQAWWRATMVTLGFAFLTVEYAPILSGSVIIAIVLVRHSWNKEDSKQLTRRIAEMVLIIAGVMFLLWPGGFIKLTIIKNYLFFTYFTLVRPASAYGSLPLTEIWGQRIVDSPQLLLALTALFFLIWQMHRKRTAAFTLPCIFYALLLFLVNLPNHAPSPTYVSSLIPALGIIIGTSAGILIQQGSIMSRVLVVITTLLMPTATALLAWPPTLDDWVPVSPDQDRVIASLQEQNVVLPRGGCLSVPALWLPSIHYYVPELTLSPYDPIAAVVNPFGRCAYALLATSPTGDPRYTPTQIVTELVPGQMVRYVIVRALKPDA